MKYLRQFDDLLIGLNKIEPRNPSPVEISFFEYSIREAGKKRGVEYSEFLQFLTYTFNSYKDGFDPKTQSGKKISDPLDYPIHQFLFVCKYHHYAMELFCTHTSANNHLRKLIQENTAIKEIKEIVVSKNMESRLLEKLKRSSILISFQSQFNAGVNIDDTIDKTFPIYYNTGISDALISATNLAVGEGYFSHEGTLTFINNKANYFKTVRGVNAFRRIIQFAKGESFVSVAPLPLDLSKMVTTMTLQLGGILFIFFHEYSHVLLGSNTDTYKLELLCDYIASTVLTCTADPILITGGLFSLFLLINPEVNLRTAITGGYPNPLIRYNQYMELMEDKGKVDLTSFIRLLDFPQRWYEEEVYVMITQQTIESRIKTFLGSQEIEGARFPNQSVNELSKTLAESTFSITPPSNEHLVTIRKKADKSYQATHFNTNTAFAILSASIASLGWTISPVQFGLYFLSMVLFLIDGVHKKIPQEAAQIIGDLSYNKQMQFEDLKKKFIPNQSEDDFNKGFEFLINLGIIRKQKDEIILSDFVLEITL